MCDPDGARRARQARRTPPGQHARGGRARMIDPRSLQAGQKVTVRDAHFGVQVTPAADGEAGLTVVQVGPDHLVLDDAATDVRTRVPLWLVNKSAQAPAAGPEAA